MLYPQTAWHCPSDRYYYGWYRGPNALKPSDDEIKSTILDRLRENPHTRGANIDVHVKDGVVLLTGGGAFGGCEARRRRRRLGCSWCGERADDPDSTA